MSTPARVFLLSPAHCGGERAGLLFRKEADFDLARRVRRPPGVPLGEVFSFLSGLYFRGKLAYAEAFASPPAGLAGVYVITPNEGLRRADEHVDLARLRAFARVDIDADDARYHRPLRRDARLLAAALGPSAEAILLGSVATGKYVDPLAEMLGDRLRFPSDFVGRGDMSRGGLLLRCVRAGQELVYVPVAGAARRGNRPVRLERLR
jgi:hypothetical protein